MSCVAVGAAARRRRCGADAHSDDSADSVELPPGMISECPGYPRSIDTDLKPAGTVAKKPYSCHPFAAIPGRDDGELPDHVGAVGRVCKFAVVHYDGRPTIAALGLAFRTAVSDRGVQILGILDP